MKNETGNVSSGALIKNSRNFKHMTINDLAFAMDKNNVKEYERKISLWESNKDYPSLEEIYKLENIIGVDAQALVDLKAQGRKSFQKTDRDDIQEKRKINDLKDAAYTFAMTWGKLLIVFIIFIFALMIIRWFNRSVNRISETEDFGDYSQNTAEEIVEGTTSNYVNGVTNEYIYENLGNNTENISQNY